MTAPEGAYAELRAREPDLSGFATSDDGLRLYYEVYGAGRTTIVLLPPTPISHSRIWKGQIHYLARHHRVVVYDGRGNGRSDSPDPGGHWLATWRRSDCRAVMDATGTESAVLAGICSDGIWPAIQIAAEFPERVLGIVALAPGVPLLSPPHPFRAAALATFEDRLEDPQGWEKQNRHFIRAHYDEFLEFFFGEMFPEPHSAKQIEDAVAYALDGPVEALLMDDEDDGMTREDAEAVCRRVRCRVLCVQGDEDNCQPFERGLRLADLTGGEHVTLEGVGHVPNARHPVLVNHLIHEFVSGLEPARNGSRRRTWVRAANRPRRALLLSSPIGLGHAWRDVAIARELRRQVPDLSVEWLAQAPLTTLLDRCGETVHPASAALAPEAALIDYDCGAHELHAFQALRRLDEIFCANFMVFNELVQDESFDVWIADEAWEVDYFLHENPEMKTAPYVWMTDFVGVLPMAAGGEREAFLASDHNEQMLEHVARHPRLRDRSIFIGDPEDVVDERFGAGLPSIREWTNDHFSFSGYVTGFDGALPDRDSLREEFGWRADETVCVVSAGGSVAGRDLLHRMAAAHELIRDRVPSVRLVLTTGPRVDPSSLPAADGLEVNGYVHELWRVLLAADIGVSHGGLSTTMELTAFQRPFVYFPLRNHFEQNHHVHHRVQRYGAGRRLDFHDVSDDDIADAIGEQAGRRVQPLPVETGGAARAASMIAELL
jgi:pimeloyl-ACP methyl ester carboxylesterase/predicted glycosyltransferase